jgi:8-oxo-dGTP pyrophosphatase MutT (NUDIX family)
MATFEQLSARGDLFHVGIKAVIFSQEGLVLVLRKADQQNGPFWDLPGGRIAGGNAEETLRREVLEETGIKNLSVGKSLGHSLYPDRLQIEDVRISLALITYRCTVPGCPTPRLSDEHTEYAWLPVNEALQRLSERFPDELFQGLTLP